MSEAELPGVSCYKRMGSTLENLSAHLSCAWGATSEQMTSSRCPPGRAFLPCLHLKWGGGRLQQGEKRGAYHLLREFICCLSKDQLNAANEIKQ